MFHNEKAGSGFTPDAQVSFGRVLKPLKLASVVDPESIVLINPGSVVRIERWRYRGATFRVVCYVVCSDVNDVTHSTLFFSDLPVYVRTISALEALAEQAAEQ